jgi:5'-deoxynucleotidase YfbR-like HD superfamily hydrolase
MLPTNCFVRTISGKLLDIFNPVDELIDIDDIAHALAHICRYNGHVKRHYSVAQHCVIISNYVKPQYALEGLMDDSPEAYIGDMISPIKRILHAFKDIEKPLQAAIYRRYAIRSSKTSHTNVKKIDRKALRTEQRDLTNRPGPYTMREVLPLDKIVPLSASKAKVLFLKRFEELYSARKITKK